MAEAESLMPAEASAGISWLDDKYFGIVAIFQQQTAYTFLPASSELLFFLGAGLVFQAKLHEI